MRDIKADLTAMKNGTCDVAVEHINGLDAEIAALQKEVADMAYQKIEKEVAAENVVILMQEVLKRAKIIAELYSEIDELKTICAEAYQVVGVLAITCKAFDYEGTIKILDNLSQQRLVHTDALPYVMPLSKWAHFRNGFLDGLSLSIPRFIRYLRKK